MSASLAVRAVQYPRRAPEVNAAGSRRLLQLLTDRDLELRVGVPLHVNVSRPGDWPLALLPRRLPALLLALLLEDPRRGRFAPLPDEPPRGRSSGGERDQVERRLAPLPPSRLPAAIQRVPRQLDHCGCLDQSAEFHARKVFTPPPAQRAPVQPAPVRTAREGAASAGRWRRDRSPPGAPDALRECAHPAAGRSHRSPPRTSRRCTDASSPGTDRRAQWPTRAPPSVWGEAAGVAPGTPAAGRSPSRSKREVIRAGD